MQTEWRAGQVFARAGVCLTQARILVHTSGIPKRIFELAAGLEASEGGVSLAVDRLERRGLVARRRGLTEDRRGVWVVLTAAGAGLVRRALGEERGAA